MRRLIPILILLLIPFLNQAADTDPLAEGNRYYNDQEYEKAVIAWESILTSGKESAELYYNLGNAWFKLGDNVKAILNYERALLLAPHDDNISFNLKLANQMVVDNIEELPRPFFSRWVSSLAQTASADGWAIRSSIAFLAFLIFLGTYLFSRIAAVKKTAFYSAIIAILFALLSFAMAKTNYNLIKNRTAAIIQCPRVTIKSSPSESGTDLFLIHEGVKVDVSDSLGTWKEVRLADGNKGWLKDSCLVII